MANKFHINNEGNPGKCLANAGGCPFGVDSDHFDSADAARSNFEKAKNDKLFAPLKKANVSSSATKVARTLKELSDLAKTSRDPEILDEAASFGSSRTLGNIASNRDAPSDVLVKAFNRAESDAVRLKLQSNENFPVGSMNEEGLKKLYYKHPLSFGKRMSENSITDSQAEIVIRDFAYHGADKMLSNPNNQISTEKLIEIAESDITHLNTVVRKNPRYPLFDRIDLLSTAQRSTAARHISDSKVLQKIHENSKGKSDESEIDEVLVANQHTPSDVLDEIGEKDASITLRKDYLFHHANASSELKDKIRALDPTRFK